MVSSILRAFPAGRRRPPRAAPLRPCASVLVPLVKDITDDGVVVYDERHARKRPDWSYE